MEKKNTRSDAIPGIGSNMLECSWMLSKDGCLLREGIIKVGHDYLRLCCFTQRVTASFVLIVKFHQSYVKRVFFAHTPCSSTPQEQLYEKKLADKKIKTVNQNQALLTGGGGVEVFEKTGGCRKIP